MRVRSWSLCAARVATAMLLCGVGPGTLWAQGVTTAAISGVVRAAGEDEVEGDEVLVVNRATGVTARSRVRRGRFLVPGLEVGGPYSVIVRRIGLEDQVRDSLFLTLGEDLRLDFRLKQLATELPAIVVRARAFSPAHTGVMTTVSDSTLGRLPTANRDLYAFVQLSPHVSTRVGVSGGGVNFRFNRFVIDGATEQALLGRNPAGNAAGGKSIPIEAVREYQVLISPYEVWQGDFAGVAVNAVTRSGTNEFHGAAFVYLRNEWLARDVAFVRQAPYDRAQFGFVLGGPIVRDRVHLFAAQEFQHLTAPAAGPFVGQSASSTTPVPVATTDIDSFARIVDSYGLEAGSARAITNGNPLVNLFTRLDIALPSWNSRLVLRHNYGHADSDRFSRPTSGSVFPLSTYGSRQVSRTHAAVVQLYSGLGTGALNEFTADYVTGPIATMPNVRQPDILAAVPRLGGTGTVQLQAGSVENALRNDAQRSFELTDNFALALGATHRLTLGAKMEFHRVGRMAVFGSAGFGPYGRWTFSNLDSLARGEAASLQVAKDFGGGDASFTGAEYSLYAGDQWEVNGRLSVVVGLRADWAVVNGHPPYAASVDSLLARRTDVVPAARPVLEPRVGFNWDITGDHRNQARGGVGVFVGRAPLLWWLQAFSNYGEGIRTLSCGPRSTDAGLPPAFNPDYRNPPTACANGQSFNTTRGGPVTILDPDLAYPRTLRTSLAYDRQLPWGVLATVEGLYSRNVRDFLFVNRALRGPTGTDRHGRVLYGTINSAGMATPSFVSNRFQEVIELANQSRNYSYDLAVQLEKRFSERLEATAAYTYSRVRDVQTPLDPLALVNWQTGRVLSGRHDVLSLGISGFDQPHRIVVAGTYTAPWATWRTGLSFYYVGGSGAPFTYTAAQDTRTGDLNADGTNLNDPIYVPQSASDTSEIRFAGLAQEVAAQQQALDAFIDGTPCLRRQRGRTMERNSCRSPWVHTVNLAMRQSLPSVRGHTLSLEIQVFNFLNLLNKDWGLVKAPNTALLRQVGQTPGLPSQSQPIFRFDPAFRSLNADNLDSYYQLQVAARYSF